jgi:hypothetical protein
MTVIGSATYLDVGLAASSMLMHPEFNKLEGCVTESGTFLLKGRDSRRESIRLSKKIFLACRAR